MERLSNLDIIWEKNFSGAIGIYKAPHKVLLTPSLMKNLVRSKMTDITLISANFQKNPVIFYPLLWSLFDSRSGLEFLGIYAANFVNDEDISNNNLEDLPCYCVRKSIWNRAGDIRNFHVVDDQKEYILGEKQIISNLIFINSQQAPQVQQLIDDVIQIAQYGLNLKEHRKNDWEYDEITINIADGRFYLNLNYKPHLMSNSLLDEWMIKWRNCLDKLPLNIGYVPDEDVRISYELSLFDLVSMFEKIQVNANRNIS